jgi:hypothetical protein
MRQKVAWGGKPLPLRARTSKESGPDLARSRTPVGAADAARTAAPKMGAERLQRGADGMLTGVFHAVSPQPSSNFLTGWWSGFAVRGIVAEKRIALERRRDVSWPEGEAGALPDQRDRGAAAAAGFATVGSSDGPCPGFLAGSEGVGGATDITHFGRLADLAAIGSLRMDEAALDGLIDAGTAALGIGMKAEWRQAVRMHLAISLGHAAVVLEADLSDHLDPAPVFRA